MSKLFISYRRDDSADVTGRLHDRLKGHFGDGTIFLDVDTIPFGLDFRQCIGDAVNQCDVLLAVIGDQWLDARYSDGPQRGSRRLDDPSDYVRIEMFMADLRIELGQGQNQAAVDLFDLIHTRKVLGDFGRAYRRLPETPRPGPGIKAPSCPTP